MPLSDERWIVGKSQQDHGEPDTFDGTVWALPTADDLRREAATGEPCELYLVAEHIRHEEYARLAAAAPELLAACEMLLAGYDEGRHALYDAVEAARAAVAKAKGE